MKKKISNNVGKLYLRYLEGSACFAYITTSSSLESRCLAVSLDYSLYLAKQLWMVPQKSEISVSLGRERSGQHLCVDFTQATLWPSYLANGANFTLETLRVLGNFSLQSRYRPPLPHLSWIHFTWLGNLISMKTNLLHSPHKHASFLSLSLSFWNLHLLKETLPGAFSKDGSAGENKSQHTHKALNLTVA